MRAHDFTLRQLQYAVAVADTGGFHRAAERCRVAQPSLSMQVAQLERALGVRLFERGPGGVVVTAAGAELLERARVLLTSANDLAQAAQRFGDPMAGTLRIGVIPTVAPYLLPAVAPALRAAHPRLDLRWVEQKTESLMAELTAGRLDAAMLAGIPEGEAFAHAVLGDDPFVLAGPVGHPLLQSDEPLRLDALRGERVLLLDDGHCLRDQALALCASAGADEARFRATSLATLTQMVAGGAGVTLLPVLALAVENRFGALAVRSFAEPGPSRTLVLAWRKASPIGAELRALAAGVREAMPG